MYAGGNVLLEPGGILTLSLDCTQEDGEEVATNTQQLRDAVRARQKTLNNTVNQLIEYRWQRHTENCSELPS